MRRPTSARRARPLAESLEGRCLLATNPAGPVDFGKVALAFEPNVGQAGAQTDYVARGPGYALEIGGTGATLTLSPPVGPDGPAPAPTTLTIGLVGAAADPVVTGVDPLPGTVNYLIGSDPSAWRTGVATYAKVLAHDVLPGIDQAYYGTGSQLEYDYIINPGADLSTLRVAFGGSTSATVGPDGSLTVHTPGGDVVQRPPVAYQVGADGARVPVTATYEVRDDGTVGFEVGAHDPSAPLTIDPVLIYSTYLGGTLDDGVFADTLGADGSLFLTGNTSSTNFPTATPIQGSSGGGTQDAFIARLNPAGTAYIFTTYFGGSGQDGANAIALDPAGNIIVVGNTASTNFPTMNAIQPTPGGGLDGFVLKLDGSGSNLIYSTYLGGSDVDNIDGVAIDGTGAAYFAGYSQSTNFPVANALFSASKGSADVVAGKIPPNGLSLAYSTYLGGTGFDRANAIAVDAAGSAYLTGFTSGGGFPIVGGLPGGYNGGVDDAFVTKINPVGTALLYSTYLGGSGIVVLNQGADVGNGIAVDGAGNAYVTGTTNSPDFPTTANAYQKASAGGYDAFVTELNALGSAAVYSTYLGGNATDQANAIALDAAGNAYVTGYTGSTNFPTINAIQPAFGGGNQDAFVAKVKAGGSKLVYSTYLDGSGAGNGAAIAVGPTGVAYVGGFTSSANFPTKDPVQGTVAGGLDGFVARINPGNPRTAADYDGDGSSDLAVFRPSTAQYLIRLSAGGVFVTTFGQIGLRDIPINGDFDGDGRSDLSVFRPASGQWLINQSSGGARVVNFGDTNLRDIPIPGDYDGDGKTDLAVFRPATGQWILSLSGGGALVVNFGDSGLRDIPIPADYDGDGKTDLAVFRPATAQWIIAYSGGGSRVVQFGASGLADIPAPGDFDGDGKADLTVFRPATAQWLTLFSGGGVRVVQFGAANLFDVPVEATTGALVALGRVRAFSLGGPTDFTPEPLEAARLQAIAPADLVVPTITNPWGRSTKGKKVAV